VYRFIRQRIGFQTRLDVVFSNDGASLLAHRLKDIMAEYKSTIEQWEA